MPRKPFKRWWTRFIPKAIERSMYVLLASLALILLFWLWQPIHTVVWRVTDPATETVLFGLSLFGWVIVVFSTFLINHFELFGLRQVMNESAARSGPAPTFRTPLLHNLVRHPIYVGSIIAFWATPAMTCGHLLFATVTTAYILIGIALEELDPTDAPAILVTMHGRHAIDFLVAEASGKAVRRYRIGNQMEPSQRLAESVHA